MAPRLGSNCRHRGETALRSGGSPGAGMSRWVEPTTIRRPSIARPVDGPCVRTWPRAPHSYEAGRIHVLGDDLHGSRKWGVRRTATTVLRNERSRSLSQTLDGREKPCECLCFRLRLYN